MVVASSNVDVLNLAVAISLVPLLGGWNAYDVA